MIAPDGRAPEGIVQSQREIHQRPTADGEAARRGRDDRSERPEMANRLVLCNRPNVIEKEGNGEGVMIGSQQREDQNDPG